MPRAARHAFTRTLRRDGVWRRRRMAAPFVSMPSTTATTFATATYGDCRARHRYRCLPRNYRLPRIYRGAHRCERCSKRGAASLSRAITIPARRRASTCKRSRISGANSSVWAPPKRSMALRERRPIRCVPLRGVACRCAADFVAVQIGSPQEFGWQFGGNLGRVVHRGVSYEPMSRIRRARERSLAARRATILRSSFATGRSSSRATLRTCTRSCEISQPARSPAIVSSCPGFINGHSHAYQILLRGWADDWTFASWRSEALYRSCRN